MASRKYWLCAKFGFSNIGFYTSFDVKSDLEYALELLASISGIVPDVWYRRGKSSEVQFCDPSTFIMSLESMDDRAYNSGRYQSAYSVFHIV